jgi:hypothetical protein
MQHLFDEPWLSEDEVREILQFEPKCPQCGEHAKYIIFYKREIHKIWREVDGSPNWNPPIRDRLLLSVNSETDDWELLHPLNSDYLKLQCENDHEWVETQLRFAAWRLWFTDSLKGTV